HVRTALPPGGATVSLHDALPIFAWWFGGGFDLTPFYPFDEDVLHWHRTARDLCGPYGGDARYQAHKRWCDEYFFLGHRGETRGRSEEHTSELQSRENLVCRLLLE